MSEGSSFDRQNVVRSTSAVEPASLGWGQIHWLIGQADMPGAEQTFGVVRIEPGKRNPLHLHPNCEELLYVIEGEADHKLGDEMFHLQAGDVIRIPRNVPHWALNTGDRPLVAVISFSAPDRRTENLENADDIA